MEKLLELKNVSLTYQTPKDEITAIKDLSFYCNKGDFLSIIGPSGCGKTTVLSLIAGLISPTFGEISISGENSGSGSKRRNLGYMLQKDELFPWRTIEKNVHLPLEIKRAKTSATKKNA
ncbi:MAG: ATP-binding cassette domain-containing protein, partial [Clostridia bacterium]|nr:ATP-binding cassette domain-containing protein [Clostridia bacterium]